MREAIPLNSIISTSSNNDNPSEPLLSQKYIYTNNNNNNVYLKVYKKPLVPTNVVLLTFKGIPLKKIEDKVICGSKRRKLPKSISDLWGVIMTFFLFVIFTILITVCLVFSKDIPVMTEPLKTTYNYLLFFIWVTNILSILSLIDTSTSDPGRQRGTPIPKNKYDLGKIKKIVGGNRYRLKYCSTCHLIRDVRTFHCDRCGLCIEKHDHHCGYLSNCIGVYNYRKFFIFVNIAFVHVSLILFTCVNFIYNFAGNPNIDFQWILIFMVIIMIFGGIFDFLIFWMIIQHILIIVQNRTTREFIKKKEYKVYDRGIMKNCNEALCRTSIKEL